MLNNAAETIDSSDLQRLLAGSTSSGLSNGNTDTGSNSISSGDIAVKVTELQELLARHGLEQSNNPSPWDIRQSAADFKAYLEDEKARTEAPTSPTTTSSTAKGSDELDGRVAELQQLLIDNKNNNNNKFSTNNNNGLNSRLTELQRLLAANGLNQDALVGETWDIRKSAEQFREGKFLLDMVLNRETDYSFTSAF